MCQQFSISGNWSFASQIFFLGENCSLLARTIARLGLESSPNAIGGIRLACSRILI